MSATTSIATAQEASSLEQGDTLHEVIVTGSRIARRDYEANSPIVTVGVDDIKQTGEVSLEMSLQQLPQLTADMNATVPLLGNGGRAQLSLRGLGAGRNLVLLDGRRMVSSDLTGSIDINTIPSTLVESVEIITGGASAVYGSDAMSGVINFKLKDKFEGLEFDAQYNESFKGDAGQQQYGVTAGSSFNEGRGNAVMHLNYMQRDLILDSARDFFADANPAVGLPQGRFLVDATNLPTQAAVNQVFAQYGVAAGTVARTRALGFNDDGTLFPTTGSIVNYKGPQRPYMIQDATRVVHAAGQYISLVQPLNRYGVFGKLNYDVTDHVRFYSQFNFSQNDVDTTAGPTQITVNMSPTNPFIPADLRTILASRPNPNAPFQFSKVLGEAGLRTFGYRFTNWQLVGGLKGDLPVVDNWTWDVYGSYGATSSRFATLGNTDSAFIEQMTLAADGGASRCEGGLDLFGFNNGIIQNNTISDDCAKLIRRQPKEETNTEAKEFQAAVGGPLGKLPAGDIQVAATLGYRNYGYEFRPDTLSFNELPEGGTDFAVYTKATDSVKEASLEVLLPILRDKPAAQALNLNVAGRYSDYDSTGGTTTYKADVEWQPISQLRFRGGYQRAYRAPNPAELYGGAQTVRSTLGAPPAGGDPCDVRGNLRNGPNAAAVRALCVGVGMPDALADTYQFLAATVGGQRVGNPDVGPEKADTYTLGVVWNRELGPANLRTSLDYYDIEITDAISAVPLEVILNKCYNIDGSNPTFDPNNFFCALHSRSADTGAIQNAQLSNLNLGGFRTTGYDLTVDVRVPLPVGSLMFNTVINYVDRWERQVLPGGLWEDVNGAVTPTAGNPLQPISPVWRGLLSLSYDFDPFRIGTRVRYIDSMIDVAALTAPATAPPGVDAYYYVDLDASWRINDTLNLRAGIINLLDKDPPIVRGTPGVTNPATYDTIGQRFFIGMTASF
ncbi:MAG TPA: TonB-dependent receptor [Steroidobacteraceae bacterium]|nr:TonB-dependent receptor [Steroidobacteraceae bacterium]